MRIIVSRIYVGLRLGGKISGFKAVRAPYPYLPRPLALSEIKSTWLLMASLVFCATVGGL